MYRDPALWAQAKQEARADTSWHTLLDFEGPETKITAYVLNDANTDEVRHRFSIEEHGEKEALKLAERKQREIEYEAVCARYAELEREAAPGGPAFGR